MAQLDNIQERQLDAFLEMNRLLTQFATTLLGALGFLLFVRRGSGTRHRWAALVGALCMAVSIFFGYVAYSFLISMLETRVFDLGPNSSSHLAQQAHFYTFIAGVVFLADFAMHNIGAGESENANDVTAA